MADTEHVLGVDRRVVARAARGDDDMIDAARADRVGQRADDLGRPTEEAGGDLGLLEDLVAESHEPMVSDKDGDREVAGRLGLAGEDRRECFERGRQDRRPSSTTPAAIPVPTAK